MGKDKWEQIYESALKLFKKFGPKKVSIDMIVTQAAVGKGTFYNYYKNKEDLYEKIIDDIVDLGKEYMMELVEKYPDPKERLMIDFLNSLHFFWDKDGIVGNLMDGNTDFFIGKIDTTYLENTHRDMVAILFADIYDTVFQKDEKLLQFSMELFAFYKHAHYMRCMCKNEKEFEDFMTKLAYFFIEWIFSTYFRKMNSVEYAGYSSQVDYFIKKFQFFKKY